MAELEEDIGRLLKKRRLTLGVVESASGGLISHLITDVPGCSDYYMGSITAYSNEIKVRVLGVKESDIMRFGVVSLQVAKQMAEGGRKVLAVDICVADTGIAGPSGATPVKPVGLFFIGLSHRGGTFSRRHVFQGDRQQNKHSAAKAALSWLKEYLSAL